MSVSEPVDYTPIPLPDFTELPLDEMRRRHYGASDMIASREAVILAARTTAAHALALAGATACA